MKLNFLKGKETKNAIWLIGGKGIQMVLSLFVGVFSARYLGAASYGTIGYATSLVSFFMAFCTLGINSVIIKEFLEHPEDQGKALGSALLLRLLSSCGAALLVISVSAILDFGEWETVAIVALCSVSLLFHVFDTINYWFQSQYKSNVTAITIFCAYLATTIYKIILLLLKKSMFWFAFASSVDYIALGVLLLVFYKKSNGPPLSFSWDKGKAILGKSYHYILSGMMVSIYNQTGTILLKQMMNEESVGYYNIAVAVCNMWPFVLGAVVDAMYPTIIRSFSEDKKQFEKRNRQLYAMVFYITVLVSVGFLVLGELAVRILYGTAYLPAATPLRILTWSTAFSYFGVARNAWFVCNEMQKYLKYMYIFAAILNVTMNVLLIPLLGPSGAAIAALVTQICTSILIPLCIKDLRPNAKLMLEAIFLRDVF